MQPADRRIRERIDRLASPLEKITPLEIDSNSLDQKHPGQFLEQRSLLSAVLCSKFGRGNVRFNSRERERERIRSNFRVDFWPLGGTFRFLLRVSPFLPWNSTLSSSFLRSRPRSLYRHADRRSNDRLERFLSSSPPSSLLLRDLLPHSLLLSTETNGRDELLLGISRPSLKFGHPLAVETVNIHLIGNRIDRVIRMILQIFPSFASCTNFFFFFSAKKCHHEQQFREKLFKVEDLLSFSEQLGETFRKVFEKIPIENFVSILDTPSKLLLILLEEFSIPFFQGRNRSS